MSNHDIRFSSKEVRKEEAEGNFRRINQLFTSVEYKHASVVRLTHNHSEVRMAFGDFVPNPSEKDIIVVRPIVGVAMPHQMARELIGHLQKLLKTVDDVSKTEKDDTTEAKQTP